MAKMVLDVHKLHKMGEIKKLGNHLYRKEDNTKNINKERSYLNEVLVGNSEKHLNEFVEKRLTDIAPYQKRKIRKDAVKGFAIILSYGQNDIPKDFSIDKWKKNSVEFLQNFFGKENVGAVVMHMDEHSPHIHAFVTPIVNNHFNSKSYFGWKGDISNWHDEYYKYVKDLGIEAPVHGGRATGKSIQEFYNIVNKYDNEKLPETEKGETVEYYRERAQAYFTKALSVFEYNKEEHRKDKKRVMALEKTNRSLYEENQSLTEKLEKHEKRAKKERVNTKELENIIEMKYVKALEDELGMKMKSIKASALTQKTLDSAIDFAYENKEYRRLASRFETAKEELVSMYQREVMEHDLGLDERYEYEEEAH